MTAEKTKNMLGIANESKGTEAPTVNTRDINASGVNKTKNEDKTGMYDSIVGEKKEIVENKPKYDITKEKSTAEEEFILKRDYTKEMNKGKTDDYYKGMLGVKKSDYVDTAKPKKTDYGAVNKPSVYDLLGGAKSGKAVETKSGKDITTKKYDIGTYTKPVPETKSGKLVPESKSGKDVPENKSGKDVTVNKYGINAYPKDYKNKYDGANYNEPSDYKSPSGIYSSDYGTKSTPYSGDYKVTPYPSTSHYEPVPEPFVGGVGYKYNSGKPPGYKPTDIRVKKPKQLDGWKRGLQVDADKLISKTKVQTFAEMIGGASTPTTSAPSTSAFVAKKPRQLPQSPTKKVPNHMSRADIQTLAPAIQSKVIAHEKAKQPKKGSQPGLFESMIGTSVKTMVKSQGMARTSPQPQVPAKPTGMAGALFGVKQTVNKPAPKPQPDKQAKIQPRPPSKQQPAKPSMVQQPKKNSGNMISGKKGKKK